MPKNFRGTALDSTMCVRPMLGYRCRFVIMSDWCCGSNSHDEALSQNCVD